MAFDFAGKEFLVAAILCAVIILVAQVMGFALGILGTILMVVIVVCLIAWALKMLGIL
jgi:hypothetical protein